MAEGYRSTHPPRFAASAPVRALRGDRPAGEPSDVEANTLSRENVAAAGRRLDWDLSNLGFS